MMLKQHVLCVLTLISSASLYANIPIESRGLSQNSSESNSSANNVAIDSGISTSNVPTNLNWQLIQKNQQLEDEIRTLRGKFEEQDNEIEQLKHELTNRYTDLDQRLELLQQKIDPESTTPEEDNQQDTPPSNTSNTSNTSNNIAPVTPNPVPATSTKATIVSTQPSNNDLDKAAYTVALDAYKQGGAKKAIAPMKNFIKNNPKSIYIGNAYFWLAEFNLAIEPTNYAEAKKNYNIVVNQYPNSAKAARAVYQLYNIAKDVDHNPTLANQFKAKLLKNYPKSEETGYFKK